MITRRTVAQLLPIVSCTMKDSTAQAISTVGIWIAVASTLTWGGFRMHWDDFMAVFFMLIIVCVICLAACVSTAAIWGLPMSLKRAPEKLEKP